MSTNHRLEINRGGIECTTKITSQLKRISKSKTTTINMNSNYRQATFLTSVPRVGLAPNDEGLEVAFAGRSNAGKSSALNAITSQKSLARISKTPGRTQQLNFFKIDDNRRLVDLPGYGYAKVPARIKQQWQQAMEHYFQKRRSLCGIFLLMDIRNPLTEFDRQMIEWCQHCKRPLHIALTKSDKLKFGAAKNSLLQVSRTLESEQLKASVQLFSATKKVGIDDAHKILDFWLHLGENKKEFR